MPKLTQAQQLEAFKVALENANHPAIAPLLATWGCAEAARTADLELLSQTHAARADQQREISEADIAHKTKAQAKKTARSGFVLLHRFIRTADRNHPGLNVKSTLDTGSLPQTEVAFLDYATAPAQPHRRPSRHRRRPGRTRLPTSPPRPTAPPARQREPGQRTRAREQGEAERAPAAYSALVEQTRIAYNYIKLIATEALKDDPQLVEILGLGKVPS